jgi:hypothetical protein
VPEFIPIDTRTGKVQVSSSDVGLPVKPLDFTNVVVIGISPSGGGGDKNYLHTQVAPAVTWSVAHSLGKFPAVSVVDSGGSLILPDVHYIDVNNLQILFGSATSGKAYLN